MSIPPGLSFADPSEYNIDPALLDYLEMPNATRTSSLTSSELSESSTLFDDIVNEAAYSTFYDDCDHFNNAIDHSDLPNLVDNVVYNDSSGDLNPPWSLGAMPSAPPERNPFYSPSLSLPSIDSEVHESAYDVVPSTTSPTLLPPFTPKSGPARYTPTSPSPAFTAQQGLRRKRRLSTSPTPNPMKRKRTDTETWREARHQPTLSRTLPIIDQKALEVYSSDPFHWSTASVIFTLTSPSSIDLSRAPLQSSLPGARVLSDILERVQIDGPRLLLCIDAIAMYNYGIIDESSQKALAFYIVRFRQRSCGYLAYCYENNHPENFLADRLIVPGQINGLAKRIELCVEDTMMDLVSRYLGARDVAYYHFPIGCIKVEKGEAGKFRFSFVTAEQETLAGSLQIKLY